MHSYLIEPMAPLVFRSGKPFGAASGADGGNFPLPSSSAGLLRTVSAEQAGIGFSEDLKQQASRGPFLVRYSEVNDLTVLVPKPVDALYLKDTNGNTQLVRLAPSAFNNVDCGSDLPVGLLPVRMQQELKGKPAKGPQYWALKDLMIWQTLEVLTFDKLEKNGLESLPTDRRTHVAIDDATLGSATGQLFQTSGLELKATKLPNAADKLAHKWSDQQLGFLVQSDQQLNSDLVTFGGERRLSRLNPLDTAYETLFPKKVTLSELRQAKGLKLTLLTPAIFAQGYLPKWIDASTMEGDCPLCPGLKLRLKAVAIERWQPVSGWDLAKWRPKAMRKAVAAGSVYWFEIDGEIPNDLVEKLWLQPLSDDDQDRRDGFGAAIVSPWNPN